MPAIYDISTNFDIFNIFYIFYREDVSIGIKLEALFFASIIVLCLVVGFVSSLKTGALAYRFDLKSFLWTNVIIAFVVASLVTATPAWWILYLALSFRAVTLVIKGVIVVTDYIVTSITAKLKGKK